MTSGAAAGSGDDVGSVSLELPAARRYAIQGELGSNSHMAALAMLGEGIEIVPCAVSSSVFDELLAGRVAGAVLPIENSLHGTVAEHDDLLLAHPVQIAGESLFRVRHNVITLPGVRLEELRVLQSHGVALSQCKRFLAAHQELQALAFYDTAGAVKQMMAKGDRSVGAIAPELAAKIYGAEVLLRDIEDHAQNYTRFLLLRRGRASAEMPSNLHLPETGLEFSKTKSQFRETASHPLKTPATKMSLAFAVANKPGTLLGALSTLAAAGADLTRIESRPVSGRPWEYVFFVELRFTLANDLTPAVRRLREQSQMVEVLGVFPAAVGISG